MIGSDLKKSLGLDNFPYVYIQKILSIAQPTFIITVDSRRPKIYLSISRVKKSRSTLVQKIKRKGIDYVIPQDFRLTPPVLIDSTNPLVNTGTLIIRRDIGADYWLNTKMFESELNLTFEILDV
jgi:hypothetical protein